jgi:hypothetical protein
MHKIDTLQSFDKGKYHYEVFTVYDDSPDMSYLGEYSNKLKPGGIDREERGDMGRNEYQYFNPGCGDPEYIEDDYKRYEAYNNQQWYMVGVVCEISVKTKSKWAVNPVVGKASIWGVESDSGNYFKELAKELISEAKADLKHLQEAICTGS